jgi:succinate dehydrogenase flavin-adding protein (antitoxin of CptAB toxin-antitoxin module)
MIKSTVINTDEIRNIFKEYCEKENTEFNEQEFQKFLEFLEIDFYDWMKENLNQFYKAK